MWQSDMCAPVLILSSGHAGHYRALEWSESEQKYVENSNLGILVEVDVSLMTMSSLYICTCAQRVSRLPCLSTGARDGTQRREDSRAL